ncbi:MAG: YkgJ family cysteine cluster protein [Rhodospirillaceae bacterium]
MIEHRFACIACGQCCFGRVPLTLDDAFSHAGLFPLAMVWTPVRPGSRSFDLTAQLGATVTLRNRKRVAVLIAPTAYHPPAFSCPALAADNLCAIHADKPLRCRTMPFFPYREERDQVDMLVPRKGWVCDVTAAAPVVYRERAIVDRAAFDRERAALLADAPALRAYLEGMVKREPALLDHLARAAMNPAAGHLILNFSSFLRIHRNHDLVAFAKRQHPVLAEFERRTAATPALAEFHRYYREWAAELEWFARRPQS